MLTSDFARDGWKVVTVADRPAPPHLAGLRIPPAWTDVQVETDPGAACYATGVDVKGRLQRLYSPAHVAAARAGKFARVAALLQEWELIESQIDGDLNDKRLPARTREAALVASLIYHTGIRPGTGCDPLADVAARGAVGLQLRHVKPCARGVRLRFVGKKGVPQNILVTDPYLVRVFRARKAATPRYTTPLFGRVGLGAYFKTLGSGGYTPKDFRTARGTSLALELLGGRVRFPKSIARRKKLINAALDKVARQLGNTRAVSRSSYVDPSIIEQFLAAGRG